MRLSLNGEGELSSNYAQEAGSWNHVTNPESTGRASARKLKMGPVVREECIAAVTDRIMDPGGAAKILHVPNDNFASNDVDLTYQGVARFLQFKRTAQTMGEYVVHFDLLRRKAESQMQPGDSSPETFVSILCVRDASPPQSDTPMVVASVQGNFGDCCGGKAHETFIRAHR